MNNDFSEYVKVVQKEMNHRGMNQHELAMFLGVTEATVSRILNFKMKPSPTFLLLSAKDLKLEKELKQAFEQLYRQAKAEKIEV